MAFQSAPDCASATVVFNKSSVEVVNRLTFAHAGGYDQTAIDNLAAIVDNWVHTHWKVMMSSAVTYVTTTVKGLENEVDLFAVNAAHTGACTHGGAVLPNNVTWAIRFTTGAIGRTARGRMFVIGLSDSEVNEPTQSMTLTEANNWIAVFDPNLGTALSGSGWAHVIVSRQLNLVKRTTATYRAVTGYGYHDLILDSQRGRLPG